jgi:DivIVA domain-containing protein
MYWLQLVVIVALLAAVGWLAIGGGGHMSEPEPDRPDLALPGDGLLAREDVDRVRFSVGARGYRMDEVDDVLDRLAQEIELREQRIAELEGRAPKQAASPEAESEPESGEEHVESRGGAEPDADEEIFELHEPVEHGENADRGQ